MACSYTFIGSIVIALNLRTGGYGDMRRSESLPREYLSVSNCTCIPVSEGVYLSPLIKRSRRRNVFNGDRIRGHRYWVTDSNLFLCRRNSPRTTRANFFFFFFELNLRIFFYFWPGHSRNSCCVLSSRKSN